MGIETTTKSSIVLTMERQMGTIQRPKPVYFSGITTGIITNKSEAQEITDQTTSRKTMALTIMPATSLDTRPEIDHSSREETPTASKTTTDRCIFGMDRKVQKEIKSKTPKIVKVIFLMSHNCLRVSPTITTTFISRMKDHI